MNTHRISFPLSAREDAARLTAVCVRWPAAASVWTGAVRCGSEACWDWRSLVGPRFPSPPPHRPCLSPSLPPSAFPCARPGGRRSVSSCLARPAGASRSESARPTESRCMWHVVSEGYISALNFEAGNYFAPIHSS